MTGNAETKKKSGLGLAPRAVAARPRVSWGEEELTEKLGTLREVPKEQLNPDPDQPRKEMKEEDLAELRASLEEHGFISPILVKELSLGEYQIVAGERRWRAAMGSEKIKSVPVIVRADLNDGLRMLLTQIAENIHRANMNPLETAQAYKRVFEATDKNADETAKLLGISKSRLSQVLAVDDAPQAVKALVEEGVTSDVNVVAGLSVLSDLDETKAGELIKKARNRELKGGGLREAVKDTVRDIKEEKRKSNRSSTKPALSPASTDQLGTNNPIESEVDQLPKTAEIQPKDEMVTITLKKSMAESLLRLIESSGADIETATALRAVLEKAGLK